MGQNPKISKNQQAQVHNDLNLNKVIYPILLGLGVVFYLVYRQFNLEDFLSIKWNLYTLAFLLIAILLYVIRHLVMSWRLKLLSGGFFDWKKSIELIFIWEFASAVSPTSLGGSAVALFLLAQEKLSGAKTVAVVLYSVIIDTFFFLVTIPLLYFFWGDLGLRSAAEEINVLTTFRTTMWSLYFFMFAYALFMLLGIIKPAIFSTIIRSIASIPFLKRFRRGLFKTANELKTTAAEIRKEPISYHIKITIATFVSWICRFMAIVFIIMAIVQTIEPTLYNFSLIYSRSELMHSIAQFFPTPGGAGFSEWAFGGFYKDYIPAGIATIIAVIWRFITYYPYLIFGVIIIPGWLRRVWVNRKKD